MPINARDAVFSVAAVALGAWAMHETREVSKDTFDPILAACTAPDDETSPSDVELIPYEARLGLGAFGPFVCLITQFLHQLKENSPAGMITWVLTLLAALPMGVLMTAEAGRTGARGLVRYPTFVGLLSQIVGVSVAFPLVWIPGCILFGSRDGSVLPLRMYAGALLNLPAISFTYWVFNLDAASYPWRICAGMLGGPILPLFNLSLWRMYPSVGAEGEAVAADPKTVATGASASARAYLVALLASLIGWGAVVKAAYRAYGLDLFAIWADVWTNADGAVRFMTVDAGVLFLAVVLFMTWRNASDGLAALAITPLLGPGAACSLVLWGRERLNESAAMEAEEKKSS